MKLRGQIRKSCHNVGIRVRQIVSLGVINAGRPNIVSLASRHGILVSEVGFVTALPEDDLNICNQTNGWLSEDENNGKDQDSEEKTSDETSRLWRGYKVGVEVKGLLHYFHEVDFERQNEYDAAFKKLKETQLEYNEMAQQMKERFGDDYNVVLSNRLGFGQI
ncbi:hypothetical protein Tco_0969986 [Tanacetum coccineum]